MYVFFIVIIVRIYNLDGNCEDAQEETSAYQPIRVTMYLHIERGPEKYTKGSRVERNSV